MASRRPEPADAPKGRNEAWPLPDDPEEEVPSWPAEGGTGDLSSRR
jgi:hypothetical protein